MIVVLWILGCAKQPATQAAVDLEPAEVVERARARDLPFALKARFTLRLDSEQVDGSTPGALILHEPDKLRVEVLTPLNTPMLYLATDGQALHAFAVREGRFFRGDDAVAVLQELAGGAIAVADVLSVVTATLPLAGQQPSTLSRIDGAVRAHFNGDEGRRLVADIDPDTGMLRRLEAGVGQRSLFVVTYAGPTRVGDSVLPEGLTISLPEVGIEAEIDVRSWEALGRVPDAFTLEAPASAEQVDLIEALRNLATQQGMGSTEEVP